MTEYIDSGIHFNSRQTSTKNNRFLQGAHVPEWMIKIKTTLILKDFLKGMTPNNYRPLTYDVENINSANKGRDLLLVNKPHIVP